MMKPETIETDHVIDELGATGSLQVECHLTWRVYDAEPSVTYRDGSACPAVAPRAVLLAVDILSAEGDYARIDFATQAGVVARWRLADDVRLHVETHIDLFEAEAVKAAGLEMC